MLIRTNVSKKGQTRLFYCIFIPKTGLLSQCLPFTFSPIAWCDIPVPRPLAVEAPGGRSKADNRFFRFNSNYFTILPFWKHKRPPAL